MFPDAENRFAMYIHAYVYEDIYVYIYIRIQAHIYAYVLHLSTHSVRALPVPPLRTRRISEGSARVCFRRGLFSVVQRRFIARL